MRRSESVQETVEVPQLHCFDQVVDVPVVLVQTLQSVEAPQVQFLDAGHRVVPQYCPSTRSG